MKTLFLSTTDINGGAARATYWLAKGLRMNGEDVSMFVQNKTGADSWVTNTSSDVGKMLDIVRSSLDSLPLRIYREKPRTAWSLNFLPNGGLINRINNFKPDVVNLHWVGGGFLPNTKLKKIRVPIVWSLYDMWPFTGGCHYDNFCDRFTDSCGSCPQLNSKGYDVSSFVFNNKRKSWSKLRMTVVAPSRWLAEQARRSALFKGMRIEVIPHGTDLNVFKPLDKRSARNVLGLPQDAKLVLFGAMGGTTDRRKGFQYLVPALKKLSIMTEHNNIQLMILGTNEPKDGEDFGFPVHYLGKLHDDVSLALLYSSADVTVTPSLQEAFGMTASESMACGTPVVAFGAAGALDVIDHKVNGYLAEPYLFEDLAHGISWTLSDSTRWSELSRASRKKCEDFFELKSVAKQYSMLYEELLSQSKEFSKDTEEHG